MISMISQGCHRTPRECLCERRCFQRGAWNLHGSLDHAVKQKLPEDYEKACTQLLAQFKTLKTFGQTEFDGRLEKTDHVESDVEREHLYNII